MQTSCFAMHLHIILQKGASKETFGLFRKQLFVVKKGSLFYINKKEMVL